MTDEDPRSYESLERFGEQLRSAAHAYNDRGLIARMRPGLIALFAVLVLGGGGVAAAALLSNGGPGSVTFLFTDPVLGRNCPGQQLNAHLVPDEQQQSYISATVTCGGDTDPGLSSDELAAAEALAIEKIGATGLSAREIDDRTGQGAPVIDPDAQIGFTNPKTQKPILCPDGTPLTQSSNEHMAPLQEHMDGGPPTGEPPETALPTCSDGETPLEYLRMLGANRKPG